MIRKAPVRSAAGVALGFVLCGPMLEIAARGYARLAGKQKVLAHDAATGWKLIPYSFKEQTEEENPYDIRINALGFRDVESYAVESTNARNVLVLGNSYVFGCGGVEEEQRFTEILEARDPRTRFHNMGVLGFSTDQEFLLLQRPELLRDADLLLLVVTPGDFDQCFSSYSDTIGRPKPRLDRDGSSFAIRPPPSPAWFDRLSERSYAFSLIDRKWRLSSGHYARHRVESDLSKEVRESLYHELLRSFRSACRAEGADFAIVYLPDRQRSADAAREIIHRMKNEEGTPVIDLGESGPFTDGASSASLFLRRDMHLNAAGHLAVAESLGRYFSEASTKSARSGTGPILPRTVHGSDG